MECEVAGSNPPPPTPTPNPNRSELLGLGLGLGLGLTFLAGTGCPALQAGPVTPQ